MTTTTEEGRGNRGNAIKTTGIMCLAFGIPVLILEVLFTVAINNNAGTGWGCNFTAGAGFWSFPWYLTAGILGTIAGKKLRPSRCLLVCYLVFSIISAIAAGLALLFSVVAAVEDWYCLGWGSSSNWHLMNTPFVHITILILCLLHFTQLIVAILASVICCRRVGCNCACCDEQPLQPTYILPMTAAALPAGQHITSHDNTFNQQYLHHQQQNLGLSYGQPHPGYQPTVHTTPQAAPQWDEKGRTMPPNPPSYTESSAPPEAGLRVQIPPEAGMRVQI